ncbi:MAG: hypothetical protein H0U85_07645 [Gemmatimonadales bacterium]|nr:hypothetical protein [Gemmatimonadales bacterium]
MIREALLKPEYASLYPEMVPGVWQAAADIAAQVMVRMQQGDAHFEHRIMNEQHFEFRGGLPTGVRRGVRSRLADRGGG